MASESFQFDAPEGTYVRTGNFTVPPQPMINVTPQPHSQAFMSSIYPTPRLSAVSVRIPATTKASKQAEKERAAAKAAAAAAAQAASSTSDGSLSGDMGNPNGAAGPAGSSELGGPTWGGPLLESPLAAQGIDAPSTSLTGGSGALSGIAGIGGQGMGFSGLGASMGRLSQKPSRPKNSVKNTSSNFVNRMVAHQDLTKILAQRTDLNSFSFLNNARSFFWLNDTTGKMKDALARISFGASPSCHDVNQFTRSHDRLDVMIGFVTGDLLWLDPISSRYARINKGGAITTSPVTQVRWLPGSENLFMAAHADGSLIVYDRDREDSSDFAPATWTATPSSSSALQAAQSLPIPVTATVAGGEVQEVLRSPSESPTDPIAPFTRPGMGQRTATESTATTADATEGANGSLSSGSVGVGRNDSILGPAPLTRANARSGNDADEPAMLVTKPGAAPIASGLPSGASMKSASSVHSINPMGTSGKGKETPWAKLNPVSHWRISHTKITDFAFSPDFAHVAIVAEDGVLRIADINSERLLDTFESYFGGLSTVAWSPDGKFLLTGGQDDLVTVWAPREGRIVARCQGHTSFVTGLAWDPWRWRDDERTYRFASVGEDCKLILWDFSSAALNRPKAHMLGSHHAGRRSSLGSTFSLLDKNRSPSSLGGRRSMERPSPISHSYISQETLRHPALPRSEVAVLQPVVTVDLDGELLTGVRFNPESIVVLRKNASIDTFTRPAPKKRTPSATASGSTRPVAESWRTTLANNSAATGGSLGQPVSPVKSRMSGLSLGFGGGGSNNQRQQNALVA